MPNILLSHLFPTVFFKRFKMKMKIKRGRERWSDQVLFVVNGIDCVKWCGRTNHRSSRTLTQSGRSSRLGTERTLTSYSAHFLSPLSPRMWLNIVFFDSWISSLNNSNCCFQSNEDDTSDKQNQYFFQRQLETGKSSIAHDNAKKWTGQSLLSLLHIAHDRNWWAANTIEALSETKCHGTLYIGKS